MSGSLRREITRNVGILSLLALCFILGIFAAEAVGTLWDRSKSARDLDPPSAGVAAPAAAQDASP